MNIRSLFQSTTSISESEKGTATLIRQHLAELLESQNDPNALIHQVISFLSTLNRQNGFVIPSEFRERFKEFGYERFHYEKYEHGILFATDDNIPFSNNPNANSIRITPDCVEIIMRKPEVVWTFGFIKRSEDSVLITNTVEKL